MLNRTIIPLTCVAALLYMLTACGDEEPRRNIDRPSSSTPQVSLNVKADADELTYGDTIRFSVNAAKEGLDIQSARVSLADSRQTLASSGDGKFSIATSLTGGGDVKLRIDVDFADGQSSLRYKDFKVRAAESPSQWSLEVLKRHPHDKSSFTQGLLVHNGFMYEGTGNLGESRIRKLDFASGEVLMERANQEDIFGEGITIFGDKLYQLTYKSARGFVYNLENFEQIDEFTYNTFTGEGWGLTNNDTALIASDGSAYLHYFDPHTFQEMARVRVFDNRGDVARLNELEYHKGIIYANIYTTADIVAIDARSGRVLHSYSARGIVDRSEVSPEMDVLNGIAIHPLNGNLLITGKYWKTLYEVKPVMK